MWRSTLPLVLLGTLTAPGCNCGAHLIPFPDADRDSGTEPDAGLLPDAGPGLDAGPMLDAGESQHDAGCVEIPGIISWWDGDAVTGATVSDIQSHHDGSAMGGVTQVAAEVGNGLSFPTTASLLEVSDSAGLMPAAGLTIEGWVRPNDLSRSWQRIFSKQTDDLSSSSYVFGISEHGGLYFGLFNSTGQTYIDGIEPLTLNAWNHVAATWDGTYMHVFIDGVQQQETQPFTTSYSGTAQPVRIGRGNTLTYWFDGAIDELTVYGRALTAAEVTSIFSAGTAGKCKH